MAAALDALAGLAPEPLCRVCLGLLDPALVDLGTHAGCEEPAATLRVPPPTLADLRALLVEVEAARPRSRQVEVGPSEMAVACQRRLAYSLAGRSAGTDGGRVKWAPMVGTAVHAMIADALAADNALLGRERWLIEQRVSPAAGIEGSCDAFDTDTNTVIDWKYVGPTRLADYAKQGPGPQYEGQIHLYGRGWERAGRRPAWVRIVFLPRSFSFDDAHEWTAPYDRATADRVLVRYRRTAELVDALDPAGQPRLWAAIPAVTATDCAWCPYYRVSRAPADQTGCPGDPDDKQARFLKGRYG